MSIAKRTVFYDTAGGVARWWDWALVTTTLGVMAEPFMVGARHTPDRNFEAIDWSDEVNRVDNIVQADIDQSLLMLSGGDHQLHGGYMDPRTGR